MVASFLDKQSFMKPNGWLFHFENFQFSTTLLLGGQEP